VAYVESLPPEANTATFILTPTIFHIMDTRLSLPPTKIDKSPFWHGVDSDAAKRTRI
jgi:hypothetical protein